MNSIFLPTVSTWQLTPPLCNQLVHQVIMLKMDTWHSAEVRYCERDRRYSISSHGRLPLVSQRNRDIETSVRC